MELSTGDLVLERLRVAAGVDADVELAKKLGMSKQAIADAKSKKTVPASWVPKAAKLFNVSTDWLFFGHGPMRPGEPQQPAENAPQQAVTTTETASCTRCAKMEEKMERLEEERRGLTQENRELWKENGDLREENATMRERLREPSGKRMVAAETA